jgi:MbtH protein
MRNLLDDREGLFHALVNDERQFSLWPAAVRVPAGWVIAHERDSRDACLDHIERTWTDLRPASLAGHPPTATAATTATATAAPTGA